MRRKGDNGNSLQLSRALYRSNRGCGIVAIHFGHLTVHQHNIERQLREQLQRVDSILRNSTVHPNFCSILYQSVVG